MNKLGLVTAVVVTLVLGGCASNRGITEIRQVDAGIKRVMIVRDAPTRETVLPVLEQWFSDNGFEYRVAESPSEADASEATFTYRAWWGWDLAMYMKEVHLTVSKAESMIGLVKFDALQYGGFGKFGNGEDRLGTIMDVLFGKITEEEANSRLGSQ